MNILDLFLMNDGPAIQNMDYLRQLIAQVRGELPSADAERLRMISGTGLGTGREEV